MLCAPGGHSPSVFLHADPYVRILGAGGDAHKQVYQGDKWDSSRSDLGCFRSLLGLAQVSDRGTVVGW